MTKSQCVECKLRRKGRPVTRHVDGSIDWVCGTCWETLGFDTYMHPEDCGCPHCQSQR